MLQRQAMLQTDKQSLQRQAVSEAENQMLKHQAVAFAYTGKMLLGLCPTCGLMTD